MRDLQAIPVAGSIFLPALREARGSAVGLARRAKLPILAASDIIGRLGMLVPSNRDAVRADPDVS
jgi:hypothetical protein